MNKLNLLLMGALIGALSFSLTGCLTPPAAGSSNMRYYRLAPGASAPSTEEGVTKKNSARILINVAVAPLLDNQRLVMSLSNFELRYQENERWMEPLSVAVGRVLEERLACTHPNAVAVPVPAGFNPDYRLNVTLEKLWGTEKGEVVVALRWILSDEKGLLAGQGRLEMKKSGWKTGDFRQLVERAGDLLGSMADDLGKGLLGLDGISKNL